MNCTNCGAGLQPVGNRPYFRCGYCETFHFPHELADGVAVTGGDAPHDCPVCAHALAHAAIDGHTVGYCETCRGFLATNAVFNQIVQLKRARNGGVPHVSLPFAPEELQRRLKCPACRKPMDAHPYHAGGNAVIDTCHRCRLVWLDAGEITVLGKYTGRAAAAVRTPDAPAHPVAAPYPVERPGFTLFGFPFTFGD